jgi:hypothetical protein
MDYSHDFAPQPQQSSSSSDSSDSDDGVDGGISDPALSAKSWLNNFFAPDNKFNSEKLALPDDLDFKTKADLELEETVQKIKEQRKQKQIPLGRKLFFFPARTSKEEIEA